MHFLFFSLFSFILTTSITCQSNSQTQLMNTEHHNNATKRILYWNQEYASLFFNLGFGHGNEPFTRMNCEWQNCEIYDESNRDSMQDEDFDAIIFNAVVLLYGFPVRRRANQRYIFFALECPAFFNFDLNYFDNHYFNWTMTYRADSDIVTPYGWFQDKRTTHFSPNQTFLSPAYSETGDHFVRSKNKMVAWVASNCKTEGKRETYIRQLSQYVSVDIYGLCGASPDLCDGNCHEILSKTHKFYLSFENTICNDYISEKLFKIMQYDIVPIVYGGADYAKFLPPMSYVTANDYTPQELAQYLIHLDQNPEEYERYFWWKEYYTMETHFLPRICDLCEKLNNPKEPEKSYESLESWWKRGQCKSPHHLLTKLKDRWIIDDIERYSNLLFTHF